MLEKVTVKWLLEHLDSTNLHWRTPVCIQAASLYRHCINESPWWHRQATDRGWGWNMLSSSWVRQQHSIQLMPTCSCSWTYYTSTLVSAGIYFISLEATWQAIHSKLKLVPLHYGVPQGSVLGPMLYSLYTHLLQIILKGHHVCYHKFVDDVVLCTFFTPSATGDLEVAMHACLIWRKLSVHDAWRWLLTHCQCHTLDDVKTKYFSIMLPSNVAKCGQMAIQLDKMCTAPADTVKLLGVVLTYTWTWRLKWTSASYLQLSPTPNRKTA